MEATDSHSGDNMDDEEVDSEASTGSEGVSDCSNESKSDSTAEETSEGESIDTSSEEDRN